jgi:hypothetical protein
MARLGIGPSAAPIRLPRGRSGPPKGCRPAARMNASPRPGNRGIPKFRRGASRNPRSQSRPSRRRDPRSRRRSVTGNLARAAGAPRHVLYLPTRADGVLEGQPVRRRTTAHKSGRLFSCGALRVNSVLFPSRRASQIPGFYPHSRKIAVLLLRCDDRRCQDRETSHRAACSSRVRITCSEQHPQSTVRAFASRYLLMNHKRAFSFSFTFTCSA